MKRRSLLISAPALLGGCVSAQPRADNATLVKQVTDTELAFARTMADRDHPAFVSLIADEAVFLMGGKPLRGRAAVADYWKRFYTEPKATFSWKPAHVQVLDSGGRPVPDTLIEIWQTNAADRYQHKRDQTPDTDRLELRRRRPCASSCGNS